MHRAISKHNLSILLRADAVTGEREKLEFLIFLPFTPGNRNNMIGWMAGRCDAENYGKLLSINFPKSRLIDGPCRSRRASIKTRNCRPVHIMEPNRAHT